MRERRKIKVDANGLKVDGLEYTETDFQKKKRKKRKVCDIKRDRYLSGFYVPFIVETFVKRYTVTYLWEWQNINTNSCVLVYQMRLRLLIVRLK